MLPDVCSFNSNNFATSAALVEVCALLSAVLVLHFDFNTSFVFCALQNIFIIVLETRMSYMCWFLLFIPSKSFYFRSLSTHSLFFT